MQKEDKINDYKQICSRVCEIARAAGAFIADQRKTFTFDKVEFKGAHNLVSYVDKEAEMMIVAGLESLVPGAGFITEEGTAKGNDGRMQWVIDPLDGTTNFVHGLPPYCVSIALMDGPEVVLGAVYEVTLGELFCAWKDSAAYLNGEPIRVSKVDSMDHALIAVGFSYGALAGDESFLGKIAWYQRNTDGIRRIGSATADLVYVACGRFDAFCQVNLSPWDVAAGAFIARQAGAVVTDYCGGPDYIFGRQIVAANPLIYPEFIKTV
ncbi:MAG: inositol monophosphatase [Alistipes sp.]|nr:inositol monophosphatase [Alistipes sp.]